MNLSVESIVTGPFQENSYFFWNNDSFDTILIDPGDDEDLISKALDKKNLVPIAIVNTHAHLDHIGAIRQLKTKYDIPFYLHENESLILDSYEETCELFGMEKKQKPEVDIWLRDEVEIKINNFKLELIRAPGHTPGGICIKIENHLFVGDTIFKGSVGRTDLPGGDLNMLEESLLYLMNNISSDITIYSGHGVETNIGIEMEKNPFLISLKSNLN